MSRRYDYQLTEDGGCALCEWMYNHANSRFWQAENLHHVALVSLQYSQGDEQILKRMREVRYYRAEMIRAEKIKEWWYEQGKKYGMLPF